MRNPVTPGLRMEQLTIMLGDRPLALLDLAVTPGEVLCIMGRSGAGKSTLLSLLAGFVDPAFSVTGRVLLDGEDLLSLPPSRRGAGLLFQDALLFPHLSVAANVAFAIPPGGSTGSRLEKANAALAELDLAGFGGRDPATLSGGQRARVALARLLLAQPRFLLLDEPFAQLDKALRRDIRALVLERVERLQLPALLATHDPEDARAAGGRTVTLLPVGDRLSEASGEDARS